MKRITLKNIQQVLKYLFIYYLSAKMICFAIPKFLFMQFRILHWQSYVPLVEISKSEHMWSFFGRSYHYNLFIGLAEFLIGVLIVFKRTRLLALLLSFIVCTNILILNVEFDIYFAIQHVLVDFLITLVLLSSYYKDIYVFFIKLGGKLNRVETYNRNRFGKFLPVLFVTTLSISYTLFALHLKSGVNEEVVGAYKIKDLQINAARVELNRSRFAKDPMIFLEYNNQVVLMLDDTLYKGSYSLMNDSINIYMYQPTKFNMKSLKGLIRNNNSISGEMNDGGAFEMSYERIAGEENYLNELYH